MTRTREITVACTLSLCLASLAAAGPGRGGGGGGGGGGKEKDGGSSQLCFSFHNRDDFDNRYAIGSSPESKPTYCHDKKAKVSATLTSDGHFQFSASSSWRADVGREIFVDWADNPANTVPVQIDGQLAGGIEISSTDDLDEQGIAHFGDIAVGLRDGIDLRQMAAGDMVTVSLRVGVHARPTESPDFDLFMRWEPASHSERSCPDQNADLVDVTCTAVSGDVCSAWTVETLDTPNDRACMSYSFDAGAPHTTYNMSTAFDVYIKP
jgi:hypothetical protein